MPPLNSDYCNSARALPSLAIPASADLLRAAQGDVEDLHWLMLQPPLRRKT